MTKAQLKAEHRFTESSSEGKYLTTIPANNNHHKLKTAVFFILIPALRVRSRKV
jgi:hypothetical protein